MEFQNLPIDLGSKLADLIEERRRGIVSSVLQSSAELPQVGSFAESVFVNALLDRLCVETEDGDREVLDQWAARNGESCLLTVESSRLIVLTCAVVAAAFVAALGESELVVRYLALRASDLEKRVESIDVHKRRMPADPSKLVARDEVVASFLAAIEAQDPLTCEHSRSVGAWCGRLAKALGMNAEAQEFAVLCGTLHDVGKITTPRMILLKPGPLTAEEWVAMRAHSADGAKMLQQVPSMREAAAVIRSHHERIDGTGYPDRLAGNAIPILARIVAVADSFHAMISKRPYRDAMPVSTAIEKLQRSRGDQWDPIVVDAMIGIVRPVAKEPTVRTARQSERLA